MSALSRYLSPPDAEPTVTASWIARQLGHRGGDALLAAYLAGLVEHFAFPPPLPHQKWGGGISAAIDARRSKWRREAIVAWLDDFLPPDAALRLDAAAMAEAAADMDANAEHLVLVASEGRRV